MDHHRPRLDAARQHEAAGPLEDRGEVGRLHESEHLHAVEGREQAGQRADAGHEQRPRLGRLCPVAGVGAGEHVDGLVLDEAPDEEEGRRGRRLTSTRRDTGEQRLVACVDAPEHALGGEPEPLGEHRLTLVTDESSVVRGLQQQRRDEARGHLLGGRRPLVVDRHDA